MLDTAIIGGGVCGLALARRLATGGWHLDHARVGLADAEFHVRLQLQTGREIISLTARRAAPRLTRRP